MFLLIKVVCKLILHLNMHFSHSKMLPVCDCAVLVAIILDRFLLLIFLYFNTPSLVCLIFLHFNNYKLCCMPYLVIDFSFLEKKNK